MCANSRSLSPGLSIDRTLKMYIGGSQKRPDAPYCRPVRGASGGVVGQVAEGNRKDIREAVEAAHKAAPGWVCSLQWGRWNLFPCLGRWGKRAAHNRAQIVYYIAENLELRHREVAQRIADMTGRLMWLSCDCHVTSMAAGRQYEDCKKEVDLSIRRLFYWGAYADKFGGTVQVHMEHKPFWVFLQVCRTVHAVTVENGVHKCQVSSFIFNATSTSCVPFCPSSLCQSFSLSSISSTRKPPSTVPLFVSMNLLESSALPALTSSLY